MAPPQPPALLTSVASPGGCRMSPRFHPVCRRPGPGSPAESRVSATAPSPSPPPAPHPIGAAPHSRAWRGRDFWSPHRTCGMDGSVAMGQSGDGVRGEDGTATGTEMGEGWETNGVGNSGWELGTGNRDGDGGGKREWGTRMEMGNGGGNWEREIGAGTGTAEGDTAVLGRLAALTGRSADSASPRRNNRAQTCARSRGSRSCR